MFNKFYFFQILIYLWECFSDNLEVLRYTQYSLQEVCLINAWVSEKQNVGYEFNVINER